MNVLFVTAEMSPLVKVGGLADVAGALPRALRHLGLDVRVALPMYGTLARNGLELRRVASAEAGAIHETHVHDVPVYLVEHPASFERDRVYGFDDDLARFLAFCDAVLASSDALDWQPDALHLHDWHAGFLAMRLGADDVHPWAGIPRVLTVHNLGHPGELPGLFTDGHDLAVVRAAGVSDATTRSALAQAVLLSDAINAVSPTYAREILTPEYGGELFPLLRLRKDDLSGILNGIDTDIFDPSTDPHLAARFDAHHLESRNENKRVLQERLRLDVHPDVPVVGMVTRLFDQKGTDLVPRAIGSMLAVGEVQLAVLGQGDADHERMLADLASKHPRRVAVELAFDEPLGHLIYGGSDIFLMPSRYEPCGLGQMIAMRYGAIPLVRRTGGLADSVTPYDATKSSGTGFVFEQATPDDLSRTLEDAITAYRDGSAWRALQRRAMAQDVSWDRSAVEYQKMYERAMERAQERVSVRR